MVGSFRAQHFQKSRKFHELPRKCFHFKPLTPTHPPGRGSFRGHVEGGRRKVGVRELEGRKVGGGRREEGRREGGEREEGGRSKGAGREEAGRKGVREEEGRGCRRE